MKKFYISIIVTAALGLSYVFNATAENKEKATTEAAVTTDAEVAKPAEAAVTTEAEVVKPAEAAVTTEAAAAEAEAAKEATDSEKKN